MPNCFVIMGFGEKTDFATGRKLNLDKTYRNIVKPAVEAAGYACIRADEILHSGVIDIPMYEMLLDADLVVADLSTSNLNAVFELGIRHALKPRATIIIAEKQFTSPFDINHIVIRRYEHLGSDIGFDEVMRMREGIQVLAQSMLNNLKTDSPVYTMLKDLDPPRRKNATTGEAGESTKAPPASDPQSYGRLLEFALKAKNDGNWDAAKQILQEIYEDQTKIDANGGKKSARPRVIQELAFVTYKGGEIAARTLGPVAAVNAFKDAISLLREIDPDTTTDPETLGLWSAIHKRRAEMEGREKVDRLDDLNAAIWAAERGFLIRQDYYNGGNLAYLLDTRASLSSGDERIADRVLARRVRRRVVAITEKWLAETNLNLDEIKLQMPSGLLEEQYWVKAAHAEALCGLGDPNANLNLKDLLEAAPYPWMADTTKAQISKLETLLLNN
jgi:hypothetical protein